MKVGTLVQFKVALETGGVDSIVLDAAPALGNLLVAWSASLNPGVVTTITGFALVAVEHIQDDPSPVRMFWREVQSGDTATFAFETIAAAGSRVLIAEFYGGPGWTLADFDSANDPADGFAPATVAVASGTVVVGEAALVVAGFGINGVNPTFAPGAWTVISEGLIFNGDEPYTAFVRGTVGAGSHSPTGAFTFASGISRGTAGISAAFTAAPGAPVGSDPAPRGLTGAPEYVIELFNSGATFGPNDKIGEVWDARNVGWSRYDRLSGKAFFTLAQSSAVLPLLDELTTHIAIWRITPTRDDLVYRGVFIDRNAAGDDVILDCFDYISLLSISRSGFKTLYPTKLLGTEIVSPEWLLAKNASSSPLGFVTTGTIENPLGTDAVTPIKTNAQFGTLDQTRLQIFFDLSEMGRANTINHVTYEIDLTNTFHFYKNRGAAAEIAFVLGGNVTDYQWMPGKARYRNDVATIGVGGTGGAAEIVATNAAEITAKGRRQDVTTLKTLAGISGGGTEADQQKAALERELKRLVQQTSGLALKVARGKVEPYVGWTMCDTATVEISNGDDLITGTRRIVGVRCLFTEAGEDIDVIVNEVAA